MADEKQPVAEPSAAQAVQYNGWDEKGTPIVVAPKEEKASPSEPPAKEASPEPKGESAAEPGAAKKPQEKPEKEEHKRSAEDRIRQLTAKVKELEERERSRTTEPKSTPEPKPEPKAVEAKAPIKPKWEDFEKDPKFGGDYNKAASAYEEARDKYFEDLADYKAEQKLAQERQRQALETQSQKIKEAWEGAKGRYADFEQKAGESMQILMAKDTHPALQQAIGSSDVMVDLVYAIGAENAQKLVDLARTDPVSAIRKLGNLEAAVLAELKKPAAETKTESGEKKDEETPAKPQPRAPKPVSEVGGRGAVGEDGLIAAARANDFRAFEAEQNRRLRASRS